jgi:taurine dioxygenase
MSLEVVPLTPTIGAEVRGVDLRTRPDDSTMREIERALYDHLVLFFRDQDIEPQQQVAFAQWFGPFEYHPFARPLAGFAEVTVLDQVDPERDGANSWHSDSSFMERPAWGSILRAVQLPSLGGDTCWANMYAAYEALSDRMKQLLDGATALHDILVPLQKAVTYGHSTVSNVDETRAKWPPARHPVVRTHPQTGRKLLYVNNNFTTRICELNEDESRVVLAFLLDHIKRPDFQVRFTWRPNSVAMWDNRCTQHYAVPDYAGQRRVMHRVTIEGERPI